jgi:hypothetical protein
MGKTLPDRMSWKILNPMDELIRFVMLARSGRFTVGELCE